MQRYDNLMNRAMARAVNCSEFCLFHVYFKSWSDMHSFLRRSIPSKERCIPVMEEFVAARVSCFCRMVMPHHGAWGLSCKFYYKTAPSGKSWSCKLRVIDLVEEQTYCFQRVGRFGFGFVEIVADCIVWRYEIGTCLLQTLI